MDQHNHGAQQEKPLILKYDKRRYDGGMEIELIEYIEAKRRTKPGPAQAPVNSEPKPLVSTSVEPLTPKEKRSKEILSEFLVGPMEMAIGAVGILTTTLAIFTFTQVKNKELLSQSKAVFKDCLKTFFQGIGHTLVSPGKVLKLAVAGP